MSVPTVLFSATRIQTRVVELARSIERAYGPSESVHLLVVLGGAFVFASDLARRLQLPVTIDFVRLSSYGSRRMTSGEVTWGLTPASVEGRHVLVVEDIVDTGLTLGVLRDALLAQAPSSLRVVTLLDKPSRRRRPVPLDFVGFTIEDVFVVGYGLDLDERYRGLPYIGTL